MAFTFLPLSASVNGRGVLVAATADPGTLIHTAVAGTAQVDEIVLTVWNTDVANRTLTLEHGSNTAGDLLPILVPAQTCISVPAIYLQNGLPLKAYGSVTNKLILTGAVHRGP